MYILLLNKYILHFKCFFPLMKIIKPKPFYAWKDSVNVHRGFANLTLVNVKCTLLLCLIL